MERGSSFVIPVLPIKCSAGTCFKHLWDSPAEKNAGVYKKVGGYLLGGKKEGV